MRPFERVQHARLRTRLAGDRLGELRRHEGLEEDGGRAALLDLFDQLLEVARRRLRLRRDPGQRDLRQVVGVGEVAERSVARDQLAPLALGEAGTELTVELLEVGDQDVGGGRIAERLGHGAGHRSEAHGIEPHVRIRPFGSLDRQRDWEQVDRAIPARDRVLERRLELASQVEDDVGVDHALDVARGELEVVRLRTGWREVRHLCVGRDPLGQEGERVEGGNHSRCRCRLVVPSTPSCRDDQNQDENDSLSHERDLYTTDGVENHYCLGDGNRTCLG